PSLGPLSRLAAAMVSAEGRWFDLRHNVCTRTTSEDSLGHDANAGFWYLPTRPSTARAIFRELPISNYSGYTFVDFGSGKGRMLLLAAEQSFAAVQGVEYNEHLHECAKNNLANKRNFNIQCKEIDALCVSAADYEFPNTNLVLYFFNPFGP